MVLQIPKDDRDWLVWHASLKDVSGKPEYPLIGRDTAKSGMGQM